MGDEMEESLRIELSDFRRGLERIDAEAGRQHEKVSRVATKQALLREAIKELERRTESSSNIIFGGGKFGRLGKFAAKGIAVGVGTHLVSGMSNEHASTAYEFGEATVQSFATGNPIPLIFRSVTWLTGKARELDQKISEFKRNLDEQIKQTRAAYEKGWLEHEREIRQEEEARRQFEAEMRRAALEQARGMVIETARYLE